MLQPTSFQFKTIQCVAIKASSKRELPAASQSRTQEDLDEAPSNSPSITMH